MNIVWYGQTCFRIIAQQGKDESINILIDAFDKEIGLRPPKLEADILIFTHDSKKSVPGGFLITDPGEYDVKGVYIQGIEALTKNGLPKKSKNFEKITIYTIETEEIKICHLGTLNQGELTSKELALIGDVDILMIPIGGKETIEAREAMKIMSQIEPKIVIPMYYKIPGLKTELNGLDKFLKPLGIKTLESLPKLSIKKKDLPAEEAKIIVLKP